MSESSWDRPAIQMHVCGAIKQQELTLWGRSTELCTYSWWCKVSFFSASQGASELKPSSHENGLLNAGLFMTQILWEVICFTKDMVLMWFSVNAVWVSFGFNYWELVAPSELYSICSWAGNSLVWAPRVVRHRALIAEQGCSHSHTLKSLNVSWAAGGMAPAKK